MTGHTVELKDVIYIGVLLVSVTVSWASLKAKADNVEKLVESNVTEIKQMKARQQTIDISLAERSQDISWIRSSIESLSQSLKPLIEGTQ